MCNRSAVLLAAAVVLASSGLVMADAPKLSLDPTVITADATAPQGSLMLGLDKIGIGQPLIDAKLNISGWVESGYTYNPRHSGTNAPGGSNYDLRGSTFIVPGPFNHEYGNHYMLNQAVIRFSRDVDTTKFDVGGMLEFMYGSDAAKIHAGGLGYDGSDPTDNGSPFDEDSSNGEVISNFKPIWQFDIPQMFLTVNVPVGNGLKVMVGKFATLLGYESFEAVNNTFYSHSYLFSAVPFTHTGVLGSMQVNDMFNMKLGVTRGWNMATEDNNGAVDVLGQVIVQPSKQLSFSFAYSIGPENADDNGHYRIALDPIVRFNATDALSLGLEALYVVDGGMNAVVNGARNHRAYGDEYGVVMYAGYKINDMLTANLRAEWAHGYNDNFAISGVDDMTNGGALSLNAFEFTVGLTVVPMPKNDLLKGLSIRPEIRYDFTDSTMNKFYPAKGRLFKDQLTFGFDLIYAF